MDHLQIAKAVTKHEWPIELFAMLQKYLSFWKRHRVKYVNFKKEMYFWSIPINMIRIGNSNINNRKNSNVYTFLYFVLSCNYYKINLKTCQYNGKEKCSYQENTCLHACCEAWNTSYPYHIYTINCLGIITDWNVSLNW